VCLYLCVGSRVCFFPGLRFGAFRWAHILHTQLCVSHSCVYTCSCLVSHCWFDSSLVCSAHAEEHAEEKVVVAVSFCLFISTCSCAASRYSCALSHFPPAPPLPPHTPPLSPLSNALADRSKMKRTPIAWRREQQRGWCLCHFCLPQQARRSSFKCCMVWLATRRRREGRGGELLNPVDANNAWMPVGREGG